MQHFSCSWQEETKVSKCFWMPSKEIPTGLCWWKEFFGHPGKPMERMYLRQMAFQSHHLNHLFNPGCWSSSLDSFKNQVRFQYFVLKNCINGRCKNHIFERSVCLWVIVSLEIWENTNTENWAYSFGGFMEFLRPTRRSWVKVLHRKYLGHSTLETIQPTERGWKPALFINVLGH